MKVPTAPMTRPCSMNTAMMLRDGAPIVFRMAMSGLFSITSSTSEATMFRAATITMRPIVIEIAIFSSQRAWKSARFSSAQVWLKYAVPSAAGIAAETSPAR